MKNKNEGYCNGYCGISCVDGSCPKANREEYAERGMPVTYSCEDCIYYKGCVDCVFFGTELCVKAENGKEGILENG